MLTQFAVGVRLSSLNTVPRTIEKARDYMRKAGEERNMDKVVINILKCFVHIIN